MNFVKKGNFCGMGGLTRFIVRRERISSLVWVFFLTLTVVGLVPAMYNILGGEVTMGEMLENPGMVAMVGTPIAAAHATFGALYTNMMHVFSAMTVGIMNIFLVVRHTRGDEEQGRLEVVRSLPVGRLAGLAATLTTAVIVNTALAIAIGGGMALVATDCMTLSGSLLWGASMGAFGLVMAAVTAIFAQLSASNRGAVSYSFIALAGMYFLRAAGDMQIAARFAYGYAPHSLLSMLSPMGLAYGTYAFAGDFWLPIIALLMLFVVFAAVAFWLNSMRDIGQGILPARPGKAEGGVLLRRPFGLALRLTRVLIIAFAVTMFFLGASYAVVLDDVPEFVAGNEMYQTLILAPAGISLERDEESGMIRAYQSGELFREIPIQFNQDGTEDFSAVVQLINEVLSVGGFTISEMFATTIIGMMAMISLVPALLIILKTKAEERVTRAEMILATPVCRIKYMAGYGVLALLSVPLMQFLLAAGLYVTGSAMLAEGALSLGFLLQAAMVYTPSLWVMVGVGILLVGLLPRMVGMIWAYYGYCFFVLFMGSMGIFPAWVSYTSPLGFVPNVPVEAVRPLALILLTLVAVLLAAIGMVGYRRRDLNVRSG